VSGLSTLILGAAGAWALVVGLAFLGQRALLYFPDTSSPDPAPLVAAGLTPLPVRADALELTAWFAPPTGRRLSVVLFHGNGGHHGYRLSFAAPLLRDGFGIVLASYPGYGGNPGRPTEATLYAAGRATLDALAERGIAAEHVVLWGESLGSGVATLLATERPVAGLVLQAPFTSVADRAQEIYFFLPARLLALDRFDNLSRIAKVSAPLLIIHGENDRVIPVEHGRRVFAAANEPKRAVFVPGADHNDLYDFRLVEHIRDFLLSLEPR
jgi:fermentation-respiration switch protein FrsA (DUF1100 family)